MEYESSCRRWNSYGKIGFTPGSRHRQNKRLTWQKQSGECFHSIADLITSMAESKTYTLELRQTISMTEYLYSATEAPGHGR
jgi:hypothetical protein